MTRSVALRASVLFTLFAVVFAGIGLASHVPVAEALFLIAGSLCAIMLFFAAVTPTHEPVLVPVRVRRNRR
jgi:hypothetical protein